MAEVKKIHLDSLKISNINSEGPNKTATGGMTANTLIKYGKKFTIEMQDALGRYDVLHDLYGANLGENKNILAITDRFAGEKTLVGTTFVIDQKTGAKQPVKICIPRFLCDSIFNLTQDAEGDISTFDLNGDILSFESESTGIVVNGKYERGADKSFYFFATDDGMKNIMNNGYRETFGEGYKAGGQALESSVADLEKMLAKFGVVTVMDVDIYDTVLFEEDQVAEKGGTIQYTIGEWDAQGTFGTRTE